MSGTPDVAAAPPDPTRRVEPDATGLYQADPAGPEWNSNRMLQLNQAGRALVGWFTPPPAFVQPIQAFPVSFAVLVADLDPALKTQAGVQFFYRTFDTIEGIDPNYVLSPFNPWDRSDPPSISDVGVGMIAIQPVSEPWDYFLQRIRVTLTFTLADGSNAPPIAFNHMVPAARVSERSIAFQPASLKRALIARHQRPIPSTFFDTSKPCGKLWRDARSLFSEPNGELAKAIRHYEAYRDTAGGSSGGTVERMLALDEFSRPLSFPWQNSMHAQLLNLLLTRSAISNTLTVGRTTKTYRDWLAGIAATQIANEKKYGQEKDSSKSNEDDDQDTKRPQIAAYPPEFDQLMAGAKLYRYDFAFSSHAKDLQVVPLIKGAAGVFGVVVKKWECAIRLDGRIPSDDDFVKVPGNDIAFYGAFFELKGGADGPPGLPARISFYSGDSLGSSAFDGAVFELYALDATLAASASIQNPAMSPSVKVAMGGDTQLMRVHAQHVVLEGTCAKGQVMPKLSASWGLHAPGWENLKKIFSRRGLAQDSDFLSFKPKLTASVGASLGLGYIGFQKTFADWMRPAPVVGSAWRQGGDARTIDACFDRDSADFPKRKPTIGRFGFS